MAYITTSQAVQRYNSTSTSFSYNFRIHVVENSINYSNNSSNITFTLEFNNNSNSSTNWWSGTATDYLPVGNLYVNGVQVKSGKIGGSSYHPSTTYSEVCSYTTDIQHNSDGSYLGTCGFSTVAGTGDYTKTYGPKNSSHSTVWEFGTPNKGMTELAPLDISLLKLTEGTYWDTDAIVVPRGNGYQTWTQYYGDGIQAGTSTISVTASSVKTKAITFPVAFSSTPLVFLTLSRTNLGDAGYYLGDVLLDVSAVSASGFTARASAGSIGGNAGTHNFDWIAIDPNTLGTIATGTSIKTITNWASSGFWNSAKGESLVSELKVIDSGSGTITTKKGNQAIGYTINFNKNFSSAPVVIACLQWNSTSKYIGDLCITLKTKTATSCLCRIYTYDSSFPAGTFTINWIAVGD